MVSKLGAQPAADASPPEYVTKRQYAADRLREMIVAGDLAAGSQVRQQTIARLLGISATPVREAIWQLESEGYLKSLPHVGFRVTQPHPDWFPEVLDLRLNLEGRLARIAAQVRTDEEAAFFQELNDRYRVAVQEKDVRETLRLNFRLHKSIWEAGHQPVTAAILSSLWAKFPRTTPAIAAKAPGEHQELVDAISARNPAEAETAMCRHLSAAYGHWKDKIEA